MREISKLIHNPSEDKDYHNNVKHFKRMIPGGSVIMSYQEFEKKGHTLYRKTFRVVYNFNNELYRTNLKLWGRK